MVAIRNVLLCVGPLVVLADGSLVPQGPVPTPPIDNGHATPQLRPQWTTTRPLSPELDRQIEAAHAAEEVARFSGYELFKRDTNANTTNETETSTVSSTTETVTSTAQTSTSTLTSTRIRTSRSTRPTTPPPPPTTRSTRSVPRSSSTPPLTPSTRTRPTTTRNPPSPTTTPSSRRPKPSNTSDDVSNSTSKTSTPDDESTTHSVSRSPQTTKQAVAPTTTPKPTSMTVRRTTTLKNGDLSTFTSVKVITPSSEPQTTGPPPSLQSDGAGSSLGRHVGRDAVVVIGGALGVACLF